MTMDNNILNMLQEIVPDRSHNYYMIILNILRDLGIYYPTEKDIIEYTNEIDYIMEAIGDSIYDPDVYSQVLSGLEDRKKAENAEKSKTDTSKLKFNNKSYLREFYSQAETESIGAQPNVYVNLERNKGQLTGIPQTETHRRNNNWRRQYNDEYAKTMYLRRSGMLPNYEHSSSTPNKGLERGERNAIIAQQLQKEYEETPKKNSNRPEPPAIRLEHLKSPPSKGILKQARTRRSRKNRKARRSRKH